MKTEPEQWLQRAQQDFDTAKYNLLGNKIDAGVFFLQQAAEKALKAIYIKRFRKISRTHDLVVLSRTLKAPSNVLESSKKLSPAYIYTRYPDVTPEADLKSKTLEFTNDAILIITWAKKNI